MGCRGGRHATRRGCGTVVFRGNHWLEGSDCGTSGRVIGGGFLMRMHDNTIFITGGTSGIGRGLAEAFHNLGNLVIVSGRRADALATVCEANPRMRSFVLDVTDPAAI